MWHPFKFFIERRKKEWEKSDQKLLENIKKFSCKEEEDIDLSGMTDLESHDED